MVSELFLDLFEGEITSIDPPFSLAKQAMNCFDWVDLSISIRKVGHIISFFMNTHAQNSVLSQIHIFTVEHSLVRLRINVNEAAIEEVRQTSS